MGQFARLRTPRGSTALVAAAVASGWLLPGSTGRSMILELTALSIVLSFDSNRWWSDRLPRMWRRGAALGALGVAAALSCVEHRAWPRAAAGAFVLACLALVEGGAGRAVSAQALLIGFWVVPALLHGLVGKYVGSASPPGSLSLGLGPVEMSSGLAPWSIGVAAVAAAFLVLFPRRAA